MTLPSFLPGLTRQSIRLTDSCLLMDARVKPAHDESSMQATG